MRSTKKQGVKQLTSAIMALVMTATTTFQMPSVSIASETDSSVAVESRIEEVTTKEAASATAQSEQVEITIQQAETDAAASTTEQANATEVTAEVTYEEEEKITLSAEVDPSGENTEESEANETRGPDETIETTTQAAEEKTSAEVGGRNRD